MEIPFVGGAYKGRSLNLNSQECQNLFPVLDPLGKKVKALFGTPGLTEWITVSAGKEVRGVHTMGAYIYALVGSTLYRINDAGVSTAMTNNVDTVSGPVWMADNGTQLMLVDGYAGYILATTTLTKISDADFPVPSSLTYQDGYFIVSQKGTGRFYISASYDGTAWDALDYATAETNADGLLSVISANRELWLIGSRSYEVWYNSGNAVFPFERINGAYNSIGCLAAHSVAQHEGVVCWLDENKHVRATNGYQVTKISTEQIDYQIGQYYIVNDAIGFIYAQEGHVFYVLTFPNAGKTWVYDFTTQMWHTRASGENDLRHRANCHAYYYYANYHVVGDYEDGKLYYYDMDAYADGAEVLRRVRVAQAVHADRKMIRHKSLEVDFEMGVGLTGDITRLSDICEWESGSVANLIFSGDTTIGQSIIGYGEYLNKVNFSLCKGDSPTGLGYAKLFLEGHTIGFGTDSIMVGNALSVSNPVDVSTLPDIGAGYVSTEFVFPDRHKLINGVNYVIAFAYSGGSTPNYVYLLGNSTGLVHSGNVCRNLSAVHTALPYDLSFKLFTTLPSNDPQVMLQWSDDGGHTWSNGYTRTMGAKGKYQTRVRWHGLGQSRDRVYKVSISDPVKVVMISANLEAEAGK